MSLSVKKNLYCLVTVLLVVGISMLIYGLCSAGHASSRVSSIADVVALFPKTAAEIETRTNRAIADAQVNIAAIIAIPDAQRTFANTMQPLDTLMGLSDFVVLHDLWQGMELVHPDAAIRDAARDAVARLNDFSVDHITYNIPLYKAFKAYVDTADLATLTPEQQYFIKDLQDDYTRRGLDRDEATRARVQALKKELGKLEQEFEANIAQDNRTITVDAAGLQGMDQDFIGSLKKTDDGLFILGVDYPTYFGIMDHCAVEQTRKKLYEQFANRGYPKNAAVLKSIIAKRDELAKLLGFPSYAALDLDSEMVKTPERAHAFLDELAKRSAPKERQEYEQFAADLPESVSLTAAKQFQPWDYPYTKAQYQEKHFKLDDRVVAQYFPMQKTIDGLLDIYHRFFKLDFTVVPAHGMFWHDDVTLVEVRRSGSEHVMGYLLLDLHPRPNKYSHACHQTIIPAVYGPHDTEPASVSLVVANFPKSTATKPSLLTFEDVGTFFHEFGHAVHALLGRTHLSTLAGTRVKTDFVEMPSQMLEEWLSDKDILKKVSSHYVSGEPLPDALIDTLIAMKRFDIGYWLQRQVLLSKLSLAYYSGDVVNDPQQVLRTLHMSISPHIMFSDMNNMYASFGHLTGYAAKYYGYLWSKVFALDLFYAIKERGLLNPAIGTRYAELVIGRGGSADPNELLSDFLGRAPNQEAFFDDLGL